MKKHMVLILAAFLLCLYSGVANAMDFTSDVCDNSLLELRCTPPRHFGQPPSRHLGPPPPRRLTPPLPGRLVPSPSRHFGLPPQGRVFVPPPPKCEIPHPPRLHKGHHCGGYHSRR